jgi:MerR family transcriptional regulator, thiopeptide resistance regulator
MPKHTVRQLARLSGVSVRTLHHYDRIGLLKPATVGRNGYRYYGEAELLRLQQILLHRELGMPLTEIGPFLAAESEGRASQLRRHRDLLSERAERYRTLIATIDGTLESLEGGRAMAPEALYHGFSAEKQAAYEEWLVEQKGEPMRQGIEASRRHLAATQPDELQARLRKLPPIEAAIAALCREGASPDDVRLAPLLRQHRDWVASMWGKPCPPASYAGLAELYETHPDFRSRHEALAPGFADFLPRAMRSWAAQAA